MRIALVTTQVPFVTGGAELLARSLRDQLVQYGHEAEIVSLPFKWYPPSVLLDQMIAASLTDISNFNGVPVDLAIGLKFPAYLARHPNLVFWLLHQHRSAYDEWDSGVSDLLHYPDGKAARNSIIKADNLAFGRAKGVYTISQNVSRRLQRYNNVASEAVYPPPPLAERHECRGYGDYIYFPSRISPPKRQDLVVEALAHTKSNVRLVFTGVPDNAQYLDAIVKRSKELGVADRIEWRGSATEDELVSLYAESLAVVYTPRDEDYGYVTLEAMLSHKAVLTCDDSGGPLEFVLDGDTGLVCAPEPAAIAQGLDRLWEDRAETERMGSASRARYDQMGVSWPLVISRLTGAEPSQDFRPAARSKPAARRPAERIHSAIKAETPAWAKDLGLEAPEDLSRFFDLGPSYEAPEARDYYASHWARYLATLDLVESYPGLKVLDVGTSPPFPFDALLQLKHPDAKFTAVEGHDVGGFSAETVVPSKDPKRPDLRVRRVRADIERDPLPFPDASFDLVLAMEILEHLAVDPWFFASEIARVLRPGGHLIVTTPNIASHQAAGRMLRGESPYSFGVFLPLLGVHGRHNREYAVGEVQDLANAVGVETDVLETRDVYRGSIEDRVADVLATFRRVPGELGQTILFRGVKRAEPKDFPRSLYPEDPRPLRAHLTASRQTPQDALVTVTVQNRSPVAWPETIGEALQLEACWIDDMGRTQSAAVLLPVPGGALPTQACALELKLGPEPSRYEGTVRLRLVSRGLGLELTGRCNVIALPLAFADFAAFLDRRGAS